MIRLDLNFHSNDAPTILCLGAHSDDIEIGALATLWDLAQAHPDSKIVWYVAAATGKRADEALASAEHCCGWFAKSDIRIQSFRDGYLPVEVAGLKESFESLKNELSPSLIFTHFGQDAHQDHRTISELAWQTFRDHLILEYEIPKYDGDLGNPNVYHAVSADALEQKIDVLSRFFATQQSKSWFTPELFKSLMRIRGMQCNSESGFAEAFYGRKLLI